MLPSLFSRPRHYDDRVLLSLLALAVLAIVLAAVLMSSGTPAEAQSARSQLSANNITYQGAFAYPAGDEWSYSGDAMTFVPDGNGGSGSMIAGGRDFDLLVGEFSIPPLVITSNFAELNKAQVLRSLRDITGGNLGCGGSCDTHEIGGLAYLDNVDRVAWNVNNWYAVGGENTDTLGWMRPDLTQPQGRWHIGPRTNEFPNTKSGDYLLTAPASVANQYLQGRTLVAGEVRPGGTFGGSQGPSLIAVAPWQSGSLAAGTELGATKLLDYPEITACMSDSSACAYPDYKANDIWGGAAWVANDAVEGVMFAGRKGLGYSCYGIPGDPFEPDFGDVPGCQNKSAAIDQACGNFYSKGWHSGPYAPTMAFYSSSDLAQVASGARQPDSVVPVSSVQMFEAFDDNCGTFSSVSYDRATGRIFVAERLAEPVSGSTAVHVWQVDGGGEGDNNGGPTPTPTAPTATATPVSGPTATPTPGNPGGGSGQELLVNTDFDDGFNGWWSGGVQVTTPAGSACVAVPSGRTPYQSQVGQNGFALTAGTAYRVAAEMSADRSTGVTIDVHEDGGGYFSHAVQEIALSTASTSTTFDFTAQRNEPGAVLVLGFSGTGASNVCIERLSLVELGVSGPSFTCASDAGALSWDDDGATKYWVYKSTDNGASYNWIGRTQGSPAATNFTDVAPVIGARYQVHYQGIPRVDCTITNEPSGGTPFQCASDAGALSWNDDGAAKYWIYKSVDNGATYNWLGRTIGSPAATNFTDLTPEVGARYQVHYQGLPRVDCTITNEPTGGNGAFTCAVNDSGVLTWADHGAAKYWLYRSVDGGSSFSWLGRAIGSPAPTTFSDPAPVAGARYQVHYQGIPRVVCTGPGGPSPASDFCAAWPDSDLYRPRATQVTVGPNDDWIGAILSAGANTEVRLLDGEYLLDRYAIYIDTDDITVRGASGDRDAVVIRGQGYGVGSEGLMLAGDRIAIADLTMVGMRDHAIAMKPNAATGLTGTRIYNVHLYDIGTQHIKGSVSAPGNRDGAVACSKLGYTPGGAAGDYNGAIDIHAGIDWSIRDNYIYNLTGEGTGCNVYDCSVNFISGPAIYMWQNSSGSIIERNIIVNSFRNIGLGLGAGHEGGAVRNNFIYRAGAGDAGIELWDADNTLVEHNTVIIGGYPGAIEYRNTNGNTIRNNLLSSPAWDRGSNSGTTLEGNIGSGSVADLVAAEDPHLRASSAARGAGEPTNLTSDIDGDVRRGSPDVGADHYTN